MIIGGKNSVLEALKSNQTINRVWIAMSSKDKFCEQIVDLCKQKHVRFDFVDKKVVDRHCVNNQGVVADVTDFKYCALQDVLTENPNLFLVVLDGIEDPHNFGSIIRVCECAGVDGVIISARRCVQVNNTVFKTSAGALNHVKIAKVGNLNDAIKTLKANNVWVFGAEANGKSVFEANLTGRIAIVVGSEGNGISHLTTKLCDEIVSLPLYGKVNSLNVSCATSAVVYEALRQRGANSKG